MWPYPLMLFFYIHFLAVLMFFIDVGTRIHIGTVFSQVKSKIHYNVTHSNDYSPLHSGTVYTEITPQWAQGGVLISVSLLWVNMMM